VELARRIFNASWYSGELYQRFAAAASANSMTTIRAGCRDPSTSSALPPRMTNLPPYCATLAPASGR
jgi:hypothetical protein